MTMLVINTIEVAYASDVEYTVDEGATHIMVRSKAALPEFEEDERKRYAVSGIFLSYYYLHHSSADIARAMGLSRSAVQKQLASIKRELRTLFESEDITL